MATRMQQRRGTAAQWTEYNPILEPGEIGFETDTNKFKIGDGVNSWSLLSYFIDETALGGSLEDYVLASTLGQANGVATLDANGDVPLSQLGNVPVTDLTGYATESYVNTAVSNLVDAAPEALNTLNELAAALGDDANYATTITTALGNKQDKVTGVSDTEIGYLDGVTSAIQTQLDAKQEIVSGVSSTEIGYLDGVTSSIQSQLNDKAPLDSPTFTGNVHLPGTTTIDGITSTELSYLNGVTSPIQTQLGDKADLEHTHAIADVTGLQAELDSKLESSDLTSYATKTYADTAASNAAAAIVDAAPAALDTLNELAAALGDDPNYATTITTALGNKQDKVTGVSDTEIGYLDGVTSNIQNQLNSKIGPAEEKILVGNIDLAGDSGYLVGNTGPNQYLLTELSVGDRVVFEPSQAGKDVTGVLVNTIFTISLVEYYEPWDSIRIQFVPGPETSIVFEDEYDTSYTIYQISQFQGKIYKALQVPINSLQAGYLANVTSDIQAALDITVKNPNPVFVLDDVGFIYSENVTGNVPIEAPVTPIKSTYGLNFGNDLDQSEKVAISSSGPDDLGGTWFNSGLVQGYKSAISYREAGSPTNKKYENSQVSLENEVQIVAAYPRALNPWAYVAYPQEDFDPDSPTYGQKLLMLFQYQNGNLTQTFYIPEIGPWNGTQLIAAYSNNFIAVVDSVNVYWFGLSAPGSSPSVATLNGSFAHGISSPKDVRFINIGFMQFLQISNNTNYALATVYGSSVEESGTGYYVESFSNPAITNGAVVKVSPSSFSGIDVIDSGGWSFFLFLNQEFNNLDLTNRRILGFFVDGEQPSAGGRLYLIVYNSQTLETEIYATSDEISFTGISTIVVSLIKTIPNKKFIGYSNLVKSLTIGDLLP